MIPRKWTDATTGYTIHRLSDDPGSSSLYFNYYGYTPSGDYLVISTPTGLSKVQLNPPTLELSPILTIDTPFNFLFTCRSHRTAYYELAEYKGQEIGGKTVMAVDIDSGETRKIAEITNGNVQAINADGTLLGGVEADPTFRPDVQAPFHTRDAKYDQAAYSGTHPDGRPMTYHEAKEYHMVRRFEAHVPTTLFVIDTATGERRDIYTCNEWMNHLLFSPTDPNMLLYCHEGPWHRLDRMWLIRIHEGRPWSIHRRTMNMEIAGHEWWSADGSTVWYDLQMPKGEVFYVAGYNVTSGARIWYSVDREDWGVHFHTNDGEMFCGDGGAENMVARAKDGKWLSIFTPIPVGDTDFGERISNPELIQGGTLGRTRVVDLKEQDYRLEPNAHFSPDNKWLVFRGNIHGGVHTYAVDLRGE